MHCSHPTTATTPEGRCEPLPSPETKAKSLTPLNADALRLLPLGHVPKVRPYWRAGYVVSPSVAFFCESLSTYARTFVSNAGVMFGKYGEHRERSGIYFTTVFTDAAQQCYARWAVGAVFPAGVLTARIALPALQVPLQWIVDDPLAPVELGYEALWRVRWALELALGLTVPCRYRRALAHSCGFVCLLTS